MRAALWTGWVSVILFSLMTVGLGRSAPQSAGVGSADTRHAHGYLFGDPHHIAIAHDFPVLVNGGAGHLTHKNDILLVNQRHQSKFKAVWMA